MYGYVLTYVRCISFALHQPSVLSCICISSNRYTCCYKGSKQAHGIAEVWLAVPDRLQQLWQWCLQQLIAAHLWHMVKHMPC